MRIDAGRCRLRTNQNLAFSANAITRQRQCFGGRRGYEYFRTRQKLPLRNRAVVSATGGLYRRQWLAAQAISRQRRIHAGTRRLPVGSRPEDHIVDGHRRVAESEKFCNRKRQRLRTSRKQRDSRCNCDTQEAAENEKASQRQQNLGLPCRERARLCLCHRRKFIWDAQGHNVEGNTVMAMSFYPNEGDPLWEQVFTHAIIHTLNVYSALYVSLSLSDRDLGQWSGRRDGISDDLLQRTASGRGWHLFDSDEVRTDLRGHPRSGPQLLPDDRQLGRASMDVDGRGVEYFSAVPGRTGMGREVIRRSAASRTTSPDTC